MTTTALKAIDWYGGIDNYILSLDEKAVSESNYVTKMRGLIASHLFLQGKLDKAATRRFGFDMNPPAIGDGHKEDDQEEAHLV